MSSPNQPNQDGDRFTAADLAAYVRAPEDPFVTDCFQRATIMVAAYTADAITDIPVDIQDLAIQEVGADLWNRRHTRNGIASFDGPDMQPLRVTRDPMKAAADILAPYLPVVIA